VDAWPFVGRDEQLRFIAAGYHDASVSGVVVVGDAGFGKTRLAREALARLAALGRRTEWVTATRSAAAIPLGAVSHLLPPECPDDGGLAAFLHAVRHFAADGGRRMVLAVDDAHLLDDPSAALVHHLAVRRLAYVLVTVRSGADTPDAVAALWRENLAARLDLGPLGSGALDEIVDHALDGVLDAVSRRELHRICAGNPLLLRELLQAGTETRVLREQAGLWRWTGGMPVTSRLAEVVATRLDTVPDDVGDAIEVIACGEPLPVGLLDRLVGPDGTVAAERSGLMMSEQSGKRVVARLAHPLYAEIIRARLTPVEVGFDLALRTIDGTIWGACYIPLPNGQRYLSTCDGLGTNTLFVTVGSGIFNTGLPPFNPAAVIRDSSRISLLTFHVGGQSDPASTARQNIVDVANGSPARTSTFSHVGATNVNLDRNMLMAMVYMEVWDGFSFRVTALAGSRHGSANSAHYRGKALDVDRIHGIPVNASNPFYTAFESACFYYGASLILGPGDPGHDTHIHCAWP
jgi:hypothetical protein